jgi:general L-amino acid transport system substrate-binding protein
VKMGLAAPDNAEVLLDVISKEPLGPVVRQGDDIWLDIVRWTLYAMINGEELGITSQNVDDIRISNDIAVRRFFGLEKNGAVAIGLNNDWAARIIAQVGNYGEVYDRNVGQFSNLKIDRGLNRLWTEGGLQYAPPIR